MSIPAHIKYLTLSILFVIASINFTRTTLSILRSSERLENAQEEVANLEVEKGELFRELAYKQSDEYIEEKARNDLSLVKPGEKVFIVPKVLGEKTEGEKKTMEVTENETQKNLEAWINLFF